MVYDIRPRDGLNAHEMGCGKQTSRKVTRDWLGDDLRRYSACYCTAPTASLITRYLPSR
jgi:hypothetical protein